MFLDEDSVLRRVDTLLKRDGATLGSRDQEILDALVEQMETFVVTTCSACLGKGGSHANNNTCKKFRRAALERAGRLRGKDEALAAAAKAGPTPVPKGPKRNWPKIISPKTAGGSSSSTELPSLTSDVTTDAEAGATASSHPGAGSKLERRSAVWVFYDKGGENPDTSQPDPEHDPHRSVYVGVDSDKSLGPVWTELDPGEKIS